MAVTGEKIKEYKLCKLMERILFKQKNPGFAHFICIAGEGIHFLIGSEGGKSVY